MRLWLISAFHRFWWLEISKSKQISGLLGEHAFHSIF
jgi:hypothetical protein